MVTFSNQGTELHDSFKLLKRSNLDRPTSSQKHYCPLSNFVLVFPLPYILTIISRLVYLNRLSTFALSKLNLYYNLIGGHLLTSHIYAQWYILEIHNSLPSPKTGITACWAVRIIQWSVRNKPHLCYTSYSLLSMISRPPAIFCYLQFNLKAHKASAAVSLPHLFEIKEGEFELDDSDIIWCPAYVRGITNLPSTSSTLCTAELT